MTTEATAVWIPRETGAIHARFSALAGNTQAASRFACEGLAWWLDRRRPKRVLEVGAGYGTLTAILRGHGIVDAIEDDPHCRSVFLRQHALAYVRLWGEDEWRARTTSPRYDLVVIDGGRPSDDYYHPLASRAVVFFEGRRRPQRARLRAIWTGRRAFCEAEWKPADRTKGYAVVLLEPSLVERLWFAAIRLREWARDAWARLAGRPIGKKRKEA